MDELTWEQVKDGKHEEWNAVQKDHVQAYIKRLSAFRLDVKFRNPTIEDFEFLGSLGEAKALTREELAKVEPISK